MPGMQGEVGYSVYPSALHIIKGNIYKSYEGGHHLTAMYYLQMKIRRKYVLISKQVGNSEAFQFEPFDGGVVGGIILRVFL